MEYLIVVADTEGNITAATRMSEAETAVELSATPMQVHIAPGPGEKLHNVAMPDELRHSLERLGDYRLVVHNGAARLVGRGDKRS